MAAHPEATKMDKWTPLVKEALVNRFGTKTDQLCALLQETGGLISGGSVLSACIEEPIEKQDTDIYVPIKHINRFLEALITKKSADPIFPAQFYNQYAASFYCSSFLRKNGIKKVYNFANGKFDDPETWIPQKEERVKLKEGIDEGCLRDVKIGTVVRVNDHRIRVECRDKRTTYHISDLEQAVMKVQHEVDVMSIRNKRSPLEVVNNFDLTFCQVWFDGKDVYASHPEHIETKQGELRYEYCLTLLGGNRFLKKRIQKYTKRGFNVTLDKKLEGGDAFKSIIAEIVSDKFGPGCTKYEDPEFKRRWFNRIAMRYFLGKRDATLEDEEYLVIPLAKTVWNNQMHKLNKDATLAKKVPYNIDCCDIDRFTQEVDDGYDSEDMDDAKLKELAIANYTGPAVEAAAVEAEAVDDLKYYRMCTKLVFNAKTNLESDGAYNLAVMAKQGADPAKAKALIGIIEDLALRTGTDKILYVEDKLFDIHNHTIDQGITRDSLESYLESTIASDDYDVKCYAAGGGEHAGCTKLLTLSEISLMVSPEFYERYSAPRPKKTGLEQNVGNFEQVFKNIRTTDPGWGAIYHATMCPYCVSFEERGEGCSVMTHVNSKGLSPYCAADKQVNALVQKYTEAAKRLDDGYVRLEWCVECGRPSSRHQHFNFDATEMIDHQKIPDPKNPQLTIYDYGSCPGGGRPEMIARMLAVGDVYRRRDIRDPKEERRLAAEAADKAPLDPALMARARELWASAQPYLDWLTRRELAVNAATAAIAATADKEQKRAAEKTAKAAFDAANPRPPSVDFSFPRSKMYIDPLYEGETNDPDYNQWLNSGPGPAPAPAPAGGRHSFKRRRGKTPKKVRNTRKL